MTEETTTEAFLDRRERELENRLEAGRAAMASLEAELSGVRRAKAAYLKASADITHRNALANALAGPGTGSLGDDPTFNALSSRDKYVVSKWGTLGGNNSGLFGAPFGSGSFAKSGNALSTETLSIKELIRLAFCSNRQFMSEGATSNELRDFIKDAFARDIDRTSLSPQLSRLKEDGIITLAGAPGSLYAGKWRLVIPNNEAPT